VMQNAKLPASFALVVEPSDGSNPIILFYVARNRGSPAAAQRQKFPVFLAFSTARLCGHHHHISMGPDFGSWRRFTSK
jgi:hypothetical protein